MKKIQKIFNIFKYYDELFGENLVEISVKQTQLTFFIRDSIKIQSLIKSFRAYPDAEILFYNDFLILRIEQLDIEKEKEAPFYDLLDVINQMSEKICQCPALEYVVSENYIKCFLDKVGLGITDLAEYEEILEAENSTLELHPQRAYLLFINIGDNDDN